MKPYTVIFYIDGDRALNTFVEKVEAADPADAWEKAKKQAKDDGGTSSGYSLGSWEWEYATEIITIAGHHDYATA